MEFPARLIWLERVFTVLLLGSVAGLAALEARSPLAAAIRDGRPWICPIELKTPSGPVSFAAAYGAKGSASLIWLDGVSWEEFSGSAPAGTRQSGEMTFASPRRAFAEPPLALEAALAPRTLTAWAAALRPPWSFEKLRLLAELARAQPGALRPAYLPKAAADRAAFLDKILGDDDSAQGRQGQPITVEVLNASYQKGVASDVTKFLRSEGADVVHYGNVGAAASAPETIVYDRTGRFENAAWVRERLGCPAQALTRVDAKSLVDVTVVLADDCKL